MRTKAIILVITFLLAVGAQAQPAPAPAPSAPGPHGRGMTRHEMGKWWKNSDVAQKLQLTDAQITQLDQIFYSHRLKLIDYGAAMEKEDLKLQNLLDADVPNEGQVSSQVDQVLAARGKLEREFTMMNLDLRKVLSPDQWKQLKSIRGERGPGHRFHFRDRMPGGDTPLPPGDAPTPPPPPDDSPQEL